MKNRAELIKGKIKNLFLLLFLIWVFVSLSMSAAFCLSAFSAAGTSAERKSILFYTVIIFSLSFIAAVSSAVFFYFRLLSVTAVLDSCAILDSSEINSMIAKNTAPFRKKYYYLYNIHSGNTRKIKLLRSDLERLYSKLKPAERRTANRND